MITRVSSPKQHLPKDMQHSVRGLIFVQLSKLTVVGHAQGVLHKVIGFTNELHVSIFNAVMDHLDKMAGTVLSYPVTAGIALWFGANGLEQKWNNIE